MSDQERDVIERAIDRALVEEWDPLDVRTHPGEHTEYRRFVPGIYSLLARGSSDVQVTRHLHQIEREELGRPELGTRDLTAIVRTLRAIERTL